MSADPYLFVRAAAVYLPAVLTFAVWLWRRPTPRMVAGAVLASAWNLPALLGLHIAAIRFGWWHFDATGGLFLGMPVDLYLSWACMWGLLPAIALPRAPLIVVVAIALTADLLLMPAAAPVLQLHQGWTVGEAIGLLTALLPAQLLARWTARDEHLSRRVALQVVAFSGLVLFVVPTIVVESSGRSWGASPGSSWSAIVLIHMLALPAIVGLTAVQEFAERGGGTPVPFDPPKRLVTTGIYAYVANPMQIAGVLALVLLGLVLRNAWVSAAGIMAHIYSAGLAGWDEEGDLQSRFGARWLRYRTSVRRWIPRWRPWFEPDAVPARLFVAQGCGMCAGAGWWLDRRITGGLTIVAAELHPSRSLTRMTYEPADGSRSAEGVEALARALEHIHFGWALLGFAIRLPGMRALVQLLADASGAEPRRVSNVAAPGNPRTQRWP